MNRQIRITHFYHSGFSVEADDLLFVFDYWRGEKNELHDQLQLLPEELKKYRAVYVFISHEHVDHLDPVVFSWKDYAPVSYFVSSDMPVGTRGKRMAPGIPRGWRKGFPSRLLIPPIWGFPFCWTGTASGFFTRGI